MAETLMLTPQMIWVLAILAVAVVLFVSEVVSVDVAALTVLVLLGINGALAPQLGMAPLLDGRELFSGFSSNAVVAVIGVMIIGAGLDRTGIMGRVAGAILKVGGKREGRILPLVTGSVSVVSSFMQNVGAAALLMPAVSRISVRTGIPLSRLLMPLGFCAILGGTVTMIGTSPLILLNDLIAHSNRSLPAGVAPMEPFGLFDVTPIGLSLVVAGTLYFMLAGHRVLPDRDDGHRESPERTMDYFRDLYRIEGELFELRVPYESPLAGLRVGDVELGYNVPFFFGMESEGEALLSPPRDSVIRGHALIALFGPRAQVEEFARRYGLEMQPELERFVEQLNPSRAGIAEVVIPPGSTLIGRQLRRVKLRKSYGLHALVVYRDGVPMRGLLRNLVFEAGDTLLLHTAWNDLAKVAEDRDFVVITDFPREEIRPHKLPHALLFFALALGLALSGTVALPVALLIGALGMVVSGVLDMEEAYRAVSWRTVFLLAGLIPLGAAMESSGTAAWVATETMALLDGVPPWGLQAAVALLATAFALVMSNVGATVLLVPLAVNMAVQAGGDPALFALIVGVATSNAFILPTHQVNALMMSPGGYRVADYLRAGGGMTVIFLVVLLGALNLFY